MFGQRSQIWSPLNLHVTVEQSEIILTVVISSLYSLQQSKDNNNKNTESSHDMCILLVIPITKFIHCSYFLILTGHIKLSVLSFNHILKLQIHIWSFLKDKYHL